MSAGALLPWRYAIGLTSFVPIFSLGLLFISPESPSWLVSKSREEKAKDSLVELRGANNMDIIVEEFGRILANDMLYNEDYITIKERIFHISTLAFLKPFGIVLVLRTFGMILSGTPIIAYFFVPLLVEAKVPIDPYWTAALLASYKGILACVLVPFIGRFSKRSVHFISGSLLVLGLISLSISTYMNHEEDILEEYPLAGWIPISSIIVIYTSHAFGWGAIIISLQVCAYKIHLQ